MIQRETDSNPRPPAPVWKLWANPIIRRYAQSRLRLQGFGISLLITLILASFIFFLARSGAHHRAGLEMMDAERAPLIPLLVLQGIILFLLGTGQVAGGMTAEGDEGVLDYQRLAPMTPLAKVMGYLFGLPIREYVLCLATLPFTLWCFWKGGVRAEVGWQLYGTFFCSGVLYHTTGLVAGTVVKNRRWAFLVSMAMVFVLYTIIPQLAKFGLVYFRYLTLWPVFDEYLPYLIPKNIGSVVETMNRLMPQARFFNLNLPESVFTMLSQAMLILTGVTIIWRRWRRHESHLLGKIWAIGVFAGIQVMLLGNALPLIDSGNVFPSRELNRRFRSFIREDWQPDGFEAVVMSGAFGLATLAFMWAISLMITPTADTQIRGWRRTRKLGKHSLPITSDPATGFFSVLVMACIGTAGWFVFSKAVVESHWFGQTMPLTALLAYSITLITGGVGFQALLEARGGKVAALTAILLGVVPLMAGTIIAAINDRLAAPSVWLFACSPVSGALFAPGATLPIADLPIELVKPLPRAFWFCQSLMVSVTMWLGIELWRRRKTTALSTLPNTTATDLQATTVAN